MTAGPAGRLYSPELLALATGLAAYPLVQDLPRRAQERSRTCGSTIELGLELDGDGRIARLGMRVAACAVGQASAALFARSAIGRSVEDVASATARIEHWLGGGGDLPDWPGLGVLEPALALTSRHEALMLPWKAAMTVLSKPGGSG